MIHVTPIPAFTDNYIWIIHDDASKQALVVDPGDAQVVIKTLEKLNLTLTSILITHHHPDHIGGLNELIQYTSGASAPLQIYGPVTEKITQITHPCKDGDTLSIPWLKREFTVFYTPGHTLDHICFYSPEPTPWLFCGDTLFSGGCGRLFEGTPEQMLDSLDRLGQCPNETLVFCTHEYTSANLKFARGVEPENKDLLQYQEKVTDLRAKQIPSLPSSIGLEKAINPFLRSREEAVIAAATQFAKEPAAPGAETFRAIRAWKDVS